MPLTPQQIAEIKRRALAKGITEQEVDLAMPQLVRDFESKMGGNAIDTAGVTVQKQTVDPSVANIAKTPEVDKGGNFITNTVKALVQPAVDYGKFVGESVIQASRVGAEALAGKQGIFGADDINKEVGQLALQNRQIIAQMKAEKDPEKKKALAVQSREIDAQIDELGNKAREIGNKQTTFLVDEEKIKDRESIALTGAKATAGAMSYAIPASIGVGGTALGTVVRAAGAGAVAGGLQGFGSSEDGQELNDTITGAVVGGATAGVLSGAGQMIIKGRSAGNRALNKMMNPFVDQYDDEIAQLAIKKGVDLPVSAKTSSNVVKQIEALGQKSFFGKKITDKVITAKSQVDDIARNLTDDLAKPVDKASIGDVVKKSFGQFEDSFNKTKTELYDAVPATVQNTPAVFDSTKETLDQIIERKSASLTPNELGLFKQLREKLDDEALTFNNIKQTRTDLYNKVKNFNDPVATGNKADLKAVVASLSDDMEETIRRTDPNSYLLFDEANKFYREGLETINSNVGRQIKNSTPEKLLDTLVRPNSETDIKLVKSMLDEKAVLELQQGFTSKLYNDSINGRTQRLSISKMRTQLKKYGEGSIRELLGDDGFAKMQQSVLDLEDIDKLTNAINRGVKPAEGSQTAFLLNSLSTMGLYAFNPLAAGAKGVMSEYGLVKLLTSEAGQKLLTEGMGEVVQNSSVKLNSPIRDTISRLITIYAARQSVIGGVVPDGTNQNNSSNNFSINEKTSNSENNKGESALPNEFDKVSGGFLQDNAPLSDNNTPIITQQSSQHPIPKFREFATKDQMIAKAFADGLGTKDVTELAALWDKFAPTSATTLPPEVEKLLEQRKVLTSAGVSTKSIDAKLTQYGFEPDTSSSLSSSTENRVQLATSGLRALDEIETLLAEDPTKIFKNALPGKLGARAYDSAAFRAVEGLLRARSGAAIPETEVRRYMNANLPRIGDSQEEREAKLSAFRKDLEDIALSSGSFDAAAVLGM